jgi:prolycopene isomerase
MLENGEAITARTFVSNISPYQVHGEMLPEDIRSRLYLKRLGNLRPSVSAIAVYLGMKPEFRGLVQGDIVNWYSTNDHSRIFRRIQESRDWVPDHLMLLAKHDASGNDTLTILYLVDGTCPNLWIEKKEKLCEQIIRQADTVYPGLIKCIDVIATASPATFERYTGNKNGAFFGFENTSDIYGEAKLPVKFHLDNLYNTGHWGLSGGGVWNVMVNGYNTSKWVLKEMNK